MHRAAVIVSVLFALAARIPVVSAQPFLPQDSRKETPKTKSQTASLTGCVDEEDGKYILINDRTRAPIADLEADGFPTEGFAKHMGHKVTIRGISNPGTGRPLFRVRSIETVSETCEPQALE